MESISVKVNYNNKIIIVGKGILQEEEILDQLQKRFPQIARLRYSLQIQYEDGASNLEQAYQNAIKNYKKSIKIKINSGKVNENTVRIELNQPLYDQKDLLNLSASEIKVDNQHEIKIIAQSSQSITQKKRLEENNVSAEILQESSQVKQTKQLQELIHQANQSHQIKNIQFIEKNQAHYIFESENTQAQIEQGLKQSEIKQLDQSLKKSSIKQQNQQQKQQQNQQQAEKSASSSPLRSHSDSRSQKQDVNEVNKQKQKSQKSSSKLLSYEHKKQIYRSKSVSESSEIESSLGERQKYQQKKDQQIIKKEQLLEQDNRKNLVQVISSKKMSAKSKSCKCSDCDRKGSQIINDKKRENSLFQQHENHRIKNVKVANLQIKIEVMKNQYDQKINKLQEKVTQITLKYQDLSIKFQNLLLSIDKGNQQRKSQNKYIQHIIKQGYQKVPQQQSKSKLNLKSSDTIVQIFQLFEKQSIKVGQIIQPKFRLVNIGNKKWPDKTFVIQKNTSQLIEIQSLNPKEDITVSFGQHKGIQLGKIQKIYQLFYYDKKGQMITFGRSFGLAVNVVKNQKPRLPFWIENDYYQSQLRVFIKKFGIKKYNPKQICQKLKEVGINEENIKQIDEALLEDVMKGF